VVDAADVEMLEDLVTAALNEALQRAQALQSEHMAGLTAGLNLPGMR
jgi:DNA-binding protein YbaB